MCVVCGQVYCPVNCPEYDDRNDPWVSGYCAGCGTALYEDGRVKCERCETEDASDGVE